MLKIVNKEIKITLKKNKDITTSQGDHWLLSTAKFLSYVVLSLQTGQTEKPTRDKKFKREVIMQSGYT